MKKIALSALVLIFGAFGASQASAATIGIAQLNNTTLMIEYLGSSGTDLYDFRYTVTFGTGGLQETDQSGHFDYLVGINFKPGTGNLVGYSGTPTTTAAGAWTYNVDTNLSSSNTNCASSPGNNNFFCGALSPMTFNNPTSSAGSLVWNFTLQITGVTDTNLFIQDGTPIRALFADADGQTSLLSLQTTAVPEPASLSLFAFGLLAAAGMSKRLSRKSLRS